MSDQNTTPEKKDRFNPNPQLVADAIPAGWISLQDVTRKCIELGIPTSRLLKAFGGDKGINPPISEHFKVVYVGRTRYMPPTSILHLDELRTLGRDAITAKAAQKKADKAAKAEAQKKAAAKAKADAKKALAKTAKKAK